MRLSNKAITVLVAIGAVIVIGLVFLSIFAGTSNGVVRAEETVNTDQSNISKEEQRRVDLFNNLVDAIQSYNQFEQSTLTQITTARSQANSGNVDQAQLTIQAVVEAYPQLKSQDNYKQAMLEFSITENRIASYRQQYNTDVKSYNQYVRTFPASFILAIMGYHSKNYQYLDFNVDNSQARDLFK